MTASKYAVVSRHARIELYGRTAAALICLALDPHHALPLGEAM
jgi:hypothetical protein